MGLLSTSLLSKQLLKAIYSVVTTLCCCMLLIYYTCKYTDIVALFETLQLLKCSNFFELKN